MTYGLNCMWSPVQYDFTDEALTYQGSLKLRLRNGNPVKRRVKGITGIVIHQTGIEYGVSRWQLKEVLGDEQLAKATRARRIAAHIVSFEGFYSKVVPLQYYVNHAQLLNRSTLGLEVEGLYPGLMDDPETVEREDLKTTWKGEPTVLTSKRLQTARYALNTLVTDARKLGMPIKYIYAHRQAKKTRRSDPGEELWRKLVLEYAIPVLELETRPTYVLGSGKPIPVEWDPQGVGHY